MAGLEKIKARTPISWDECFMRMAHTISLRSRDPNTQNGAVIVNDSKVVVGLGYNGFPRGVDDSKLPWEREGSFCDTKYAYVVHAEENAIYNSNAKTQGCTLYCTLFPCNECSKTIIQSGITEVIFESDKYHDNDVWVASRRLLDLAGVSYRQYISGKELIAEPTEPKLKIKKINPDAVIPDYAYDNDAGIDLYADESLEIAPGSRAKIPTGLAFEIPRDYVGLIWDRTSIPIKKGLKTIGGVVDSGYRGELFIGLANISRESVTVSKGEKVAQMVIQKFEKPNIEIAEELSKSERGANTLGSSDLKKIDPIEDLGIDFLPEDELELLEPEDEIVIEELNMLNEEAPTNEVVGVPTDSVGKGQNAKSRW